MRLICLWNINCIAIKLHQNDLWERKKKIIEGLQVAKKRKTARLHSVIVALKMDSVTLKGQKHRHKHDWIHVQQDTDFSNAFNGKDTPPNVWRFSFMFLHFVRVPAVLIFFSSLLRCFCRSEANIHDVFVCISVRAHHDAYIHWSCSYFCSSYAHGIAYKAVPFLMIYALLKFFHKRFFFSFVSSSLSFACAWENLNKFHSYKLLYGAFECAPYPK